MKKIKRVNPGARGFQELYQREDEYIVVSTTDLVDMGGSEEETMAFPADEDGKVTGWGEIAVARGSGSRNTVLEELSE